MASNEGEKSLREQQVAARKEHMAKINPPAPRVRVNPASDELRRALKHPQGGIAFPKEGSVEWPLDQFTRRRIKEGSVTAEPKREEKHEEVDRRGGSRRAQAHEPAA
jgi:hypothetical protein